MTPEELKEIEERCAKATPGPWKACHGGTCSCSQIWSQSTDVPVAEVTRGEWGDPGLPYGKIPEEIAQANSLFIAHAREDVPKLLEYIKELQYEIDMLSASPDETSSHCGTFLEEREGLR